MTQSVPPILYKYLPEQNKDFFTTRQLNFDQLAKLNILFDYAVGLGGTINPSLLERILTAKRDQRLDTFFEAPPKNETGLLSSLKQLFYPIASEAIKIFSQPALNDTADERAKEFNEKKLPSVIMDIKKKFRDVGILSLTSCNDSPAIWTNSAYAFSNPALSGVMIGLDTGHKFFHRGNDIANALQQVVYPLPQEKWYLTDFFSGKDKDEKKRSVVLYSKNSSFCYEHEWRLAFIPHSAGKPEVVPPGLIKSVYIGTRAGTELTNGAFTFCCQYGIPLFRMVPSLEGTLQPELYLFP